MEAGISTRVRARMRRVVGIRRAAADHPLGEIAPAPALVAEADGEIGPQVRVDGAAAAAAVVGVAEDSVVEEDSVAAGSVASEESRSTPRERLLEDFRCMTSLAIA